MFRYLGSEPTVNLLLLLPRPMATSTLQSILLVPPPLNFSKSLPSSPAFHASTLPSDDESNLAQSRKIRFAPLPIVPDPDCILEDGQYDESLCLESTDSIPCTPGQIPPPPLPAVVSLNPSTSSTSLQSLPTSKKSFSSKFIKPLFTPWSKSVSAPSSTNGDSPPLSRVSSIESSQSLRAGSLNRWTSAGSVRSSVSDSGHTLGRRSTPSLSSSLNPLNRRSKSTPLPNKQYTPSAKPGMRMLNGRVYGRRRPYSQASTDPFANVRTTEPEFVEWGYGGMGSNKSNTNSSMGSAWKVVQNGKNASAFGNDDDDSSGMAWVKKRRAERERAKLEADKKEQEERGDADVEEPQPIIPEEEEQQAPQLPKEDSIPHPPTDTPTAAPAEEPHEASQHITTAINLPPHRLHKREVSLTRRVQTPQAEGPSKGEPLFDMELDEKPEAAPEIPEANTSSTSEEEDDEDEDSSSGSNGDDEDESDVNSEVCVPPFLVPIPLADPGRFRRGIRIARRPWALVSRKSAGIRTYLSRRPPICRTPL